MTKRARHGFLLAAVLLSATLAAAAATPPDETAQVSGRVCSPDGCGVQGVILTIRDTATGRTSRLTSGLSGTYRGAGLAPGAYEIVAEAPGFSPQVVPDLRLGPGETRTVDITMAFASVEKVVTVIGAAPRGALQAAEARESAGRDVGEALTRVTGIWKVRKGGIANDVVVRGFAGKDVNILIDGQRLYGACPSHMDPAAFHVDFSEVDRVETAMGPFDIRNQGSLGGVLNIITRNPEPGFHGSVVLSSGAYGFYNPSATLSLARGAFSALGGFSYRRSMPYADPSGQRFTAYANYLPGTDETAAFKAGTGWTKMSYTPRSGHLIQLAYTRQEADHVLYPYLMMDAIFDNTDRLNMSYVISPSSGPFKSLHLQTYFSQVRHYMTDAFRLSSVDKPREYSMGTMAATSAVGAKVEASTSRWTFGLEAYDRGWDATTEMAGMAYAPQYSIPDVATRSLGGFLEYRRDLAARLRLAAGARFDVAQTKADPSQANTDLYYAYHTTRSIVAGDAFPSGHVRLAYFPSTAVELAVGLGHTVRIPDARERYFALKRAGSDWVGNPDLDPSRNSGLDARVSIRSGAFLFKGSVYANDVRDFINVVNSPKVNDVPGVMNVQSRSYENVHARISGSEVEGFWTIARSWSFSTSLVYVRDAAGRHRDRHGPGEPRRDPASLLPIRPEVRQRESLGRDRGPHRRPPVQGRRRSSRGGHRRA
jgi:iron complex outermembrane receptor protein